MATSYDNVGGKGDRTAIITATNSAGLFYPAYDNPNTLLDGVKTGNFLAFANTSATGHWILFDFLEGNSRIITEAKWFQDTSDEEGTWKWQGSGNGSDWTDIGSTFTLGGSAEQTQTTLSANATGYRYYRLLATAGNINWLPSLREIEFKISSDSNIAKVSNIAVASIAKISSVAITDIGKISGVD